MASDTPSTPTSSTQSPDRHHRAGLSAVHEGKQKAGELLDHTGAALSSAADQSSDAVTALGTQLIQFTRENPLMALLLAASAGALVATPMTAASLRR